jgi:two-component system, NtrC family, sensor histidine kinase HydH
VRRAIIAIALLAAIALGVTVWFAQRTLSRASDVIVRGEAETVIASIQGDLAQQGSPPTSLILQQELNKYDDKGLRYVALREPQRIIAEAGKDAIPQTVFRPGTVIVQAGRVRVNAVMPPPRPRMFEAPPPPMFGPVFIVVELEPPVLRELRGNMQRITIVAGAAAIVLLALALATSRSAARLAELEQRAAREQRLVALGSMSSVMAHELRNPLASLKGHAQLLVEDLEGKQKEKAERVVSEAERLEGLTTSLLDFVRDGPIERARVGSEALLDRALRDLPRDRVKIRGKAVVLADEERLSRALHNVIDNALKASEGNVEVSVRDGEISVRDHGEGLPSDKAIFDPFVTTRVRGTGLGLPVARRIAEQHGGTLTGENADGGGAVFTFRIPT